MMTTSFKLYNTLSRQVEQFKPQNAAEVSVYTCGPTVYGEQHIGNFRTFIFEDILIRTLMLQGFKVRRVLNITDVGHLTSDGDTGQDKLEVGAKRDGTTAWAVAEHYTSRFLADMSALHLLAPDRLVKATESIPSQISYIQGLEAKGFTYLTDDGVYFDSSKLPDYGILARLSLEGMRAGERVEMGQKRGEQDFALWKFSPSDSKRDMEWESPWGKGFPGWHIECSAIIKQELGDQIDIHCGGVDHIPVHHTNEIAQTEALTGGHLANYWMHCEFLQVEGGKMAKSLGNIFTLKDLEAKQIDPLALRLLYYSANYRSKLNFTWDGLEAAAKGLHSLRFKYAEAHLASQTDLMADQLIDRFNTALFDDLNTATALAVLYEGEKNLTGPELQRFFQHVDSIFQLDLTRGVETFEVPDQVKALVAEREQARQQRDWAQADAVRQQIAQLGFGVRDGAVPEPFPLDKP